MSVTYVLVFIFDISYSTLKLFTPIFIWLFALKFLFKEPSPALFFIVVFGTAGALMKFLGYDLHYFKKYYLKN